MNPRSNGVRLLIGLCLILFQVQVLASVFLGCRHAVDAGADSSVAACPMHHAAGDAAGLGGADAQRLLDCHKCALHCALGGPAHVAPLVSLAAVPAASLPSPLAQGHFYRYSPESSFKPPIPQGL